MNPSLWKTDTKKQKKGARKRDYGHSFESQKRAGMELMGALYAPVREPSVGPVMGF